MDVMLNVHVKASIWINRTKKRLLNHFWYVCMSPTTCTCFTISYANAYMWVVMIVACLWRFGIFPFHYIIRDPHSKSCISQYRKTGDICCSNKVQSETACYQWQVRTFAQIIVGKLEICIDVETSLMENYGRTLPNNNNIQICKAPYSKAF